MEQFKLFFEEKITRLNEDHIRNLALLAKVDGYVHEDELDLLYKIAERLNYDRAEVNRLVNSMNEYRPRIPVLYSQRLGQLFDLVMMMLADGRIQETELRFCKNLAKHFGFKASIVKAIINYSLEEEANEYDWMDFAEECKKYIKAVNFKKISDN